MPCTEKRRAFYFLFTQGFYFILKAQERGVGRCFPRRLLAYYEVEIIVAPSLCGGLPEEGEEAVLVDFEEALVAEELA